MKNFLNKFARAAVGRRGIGVIMTAAVITLVVLLNVIAYTVTSAYGLYLYSPDNEDFSISGNTDSLFEDAQQRGAKVRIVFCYEEDRLKNHDTGAFVLDTAYRFRDRYPDLIELKFVNMLTMLDEDGNAYDFDKYKDESGEYTYSINSSSVIFETGEGSTFNYRIMTDLSTSSGFVGFYTLDSSANILAYNGEEVMASMISWVLHDEHPVAYLTQGHGETADITFSNILTCAGYYVDVIDLRKAKSIPDDAGLVIISNPTSDFDRGLEGTDTVGEIEKLELYLENGGKLYAALDPYVKSLPNLEGLIAGYGIGLSGDETVGSQALRDIVKESADAITTDGYTFVASHADGDVSEAILANVSRFGSDRVLISTCGVLDTDASLGAAPLLVSGRSSETYAGGERTDSDGGYTVAAYSRQTNENGTVSTVFVIPTIYLTTSEAIVSYGYSNKDFVYSVLEELFDAPTAPYGCNAVLYNTQILENFTMGRARAYTALVMLVPFCLAVLGVVIIVRRKNR